MALETHKNIKKKAAQGVLILQHTFRLEFECRLFQYSWLPDVLRIEGSVRVYPDNSVRQSRLTSGREDPYTDSGPRPDGDYICDWHCDSLPFRLQCHPHQLCSAPTGRSRESL